MVQRFYKIIVALCLVVYGPDVIGQDFSKKIPVLSVIGPAPMIKFSIHPERTKHTYSSIRSHHYAGARSYQVIKNHAVTASVAGNYYTQNFGFMCKKELHLQKSTGIPLRFRLGSLQYCDAMEGKKIGIQ